MMEEPLPDVDNIGNFDKYIGVTVKLDDEANSGGNIVTSKRRANDEKYSQLDEHTITHFWIPESMRLS